MAKQLEDVCVQYACCMQVDLPFRRDQRELQVQVTHLDHSDLSLDKHSEASSDGSPAASASPSSAASSAPAAATAERPAKRQREDEHGHHASTEQTSRDSTLCARLRWKDPQSGRQREFAAETGASAYHWNTIDQVQIAWKNAQAARTALEVQCCSCDCARGHGGVHVF